MINENYNPNLLVRCSELSKLMTKGRSKTSPLGETTKSYVMQKAKEEFYGIYPQLTGKFLDKGIKNEIVGIEMVNQTRFKQYEKNDIRKNNGWLSGECDINTGDRIIDITCSWSFDSFPCFNDEAVKAVKKSGYDWQMRGYMMLWDLPTAEVIYCLTTTPPELLSSYDDIALHDVDHIDPEYRMTSVEVLRDISIEQEMKEQYDIANSYYKQCLQELYSK